MKEIFKKYWYIIIILICLLFMYFVVNPVESSDIKLNDTYEVVDDVFEKTNELSEEVSNYYVDIKGEVVKPGVYEISKDSRIIDVINKAGGLTKNADTSLLNLSKKVIDEMNIRVYSKTEVKKAKENVNKEPEVIEIIKEIEKECVCPETNNTCDNNNDALLDIENNELIVNKENTTEKEENKLINLNTATKEELMNIPNIGESKANSIIEYRNKNKFKKIDDILNVSGIGDSVFEKIKEYITV